MSAVITDHLPLWTSAPNGIAKLRELILELAVRGLLVPQDPNDEPASVLLQKITAEKEALFQAGKVRKPKPLSEIDEDEKPFELPEGWEWVRLGTISTKLTDGSHNPPKDAGQGYPMLSSQNVNFGKIDFTAPSRYVDEAGFLTEDSRTKIQPKDVLLTIVASLGRPAVVPDNAPKFVLQRSVAVIRTPIESEFLCRHLASPVCLNYYDQHGKGTAQKGIYLGKLSEMPIALPPLAEQSRIVAKVDELMALCDRLEQQQDQQQALHQTLVGTVLDSLIQAPSPEAFHSAWERIAAHFDTLLTTEDSINRLKQSLLQLAVMGKLVPQDPNDEPAALLLQKIAVKKEALVKAGKIKKPKPLPEIGEEEKPFELPVGWEWSRLPEIGELARGKSKHRPRNDPKLYAGGTIPLVQTGDVARSKRVISSCTALYNEVGLAQSRLWPVGTLCITIAANIADTGILGFEACFPDSVVGFIPFDENLAIQYFELFIRTAKNHLEDFAPSTAQKNINLEILGDVLVPLPPAAELNRIVAKVNELMTLCDRLSARLQEAQTTQTRLAEAIVEQAVA